MECLQTGVMPADCFVHQTNNYLRMLGRRCSDQLLRFLNFAIAKFFFVLEQNSQFMQLGCHF